MRITSFVVTQTTESLTGFKKSLSINALRLILISFLFAGPAIAQDVMTAEDFAFDAHQLLAGTAPSDEKKAEMVKLIKEGKIDDALNLAIETDGFYNDRLPMWVKKWFNENDTNMVPLNDSVVTVVGAVRDNVPFKQLLYGDILYVFDESKLPQGDDSIAVGALDSNEHYQELDNRKYSLKDVISRTTQSEYYQIPSNQEIAGLYTTRGWAAAFYEDGTNRAAFSYTMKNFFCKEMEDVHDTSIPTYHISRDVSREPAGNPETFVNTCQGCHAGMDGMREAFAHIDFDDGALVYNQNIDPKFSINRETFPEGWVTSNNNWINLWTQGQNANLGWRVEDAATGALTAPSGAIEGKGIAEFGKMVGNASQFSSCMAEQVFELLCFHKPRTAEEKQAVLNIGRRFEAQGQYDLKEIFRRTGEYCTLNGKIVR